MKSVVNNVSTGGPAVIHHFRNLVCMGRRLISFRHSVSLDTCSHFAAYLVIGLWK